MSHDLKEGRVDATDWEEFPGGFRPILKREGNTILTMNDSNVKFHGALTNEQETHCDINIVFHGTVLTSRLLGANLEGQQRDQKVVTCPTPPQNMASSCISLFYTPPCLARNHQHPYWPGRLSNRKCLLGALLSRAWNSTKWNKTQLPYR